MRGGRRVESRERENLGHVELQVIVNVGYVYIG